MNNEFKSYQIIMAPIAHKAIKCTAKHSGLKIGEFIADMFDRHKNEYLTGILEPLESEIAEIKEIMGRK